MQVILGIESYIFLVVLSAPYSLGAGYMAGLWFHKYMCMKLWDTNQSSKVICEALIWSRRSAATLLKFMAIHLI